VHASWVNQVELFFSIITRKVIKRGNFTSREDLVSKPMRYIATYKETATPSHGPTAENHSKSRYDHARHYRAGALAG